jgi:hypothetical protein
MIEMYIRPAEPEQNFYFIHERCKTTGSTQNDHPILHCYYGRSLFDRSQTETTLTLCENDVRIRTWMRIYFYHSKACFKIKKSIADRRAKQGLFPKSGLHYAAGFSSAE